MKRLWAFIFLSFVAGCQTPYNRKDLPLATNVSATTDTSYVPKAEWGGFVWPVAIVYGRDQLFYVADSLANRLVMLNQAGQVLSTLENILHPTSIGQDTRLDLIVGAEAREPTTGDTMGVLLRIKLVPASHALDRAVIDTIWREPARPRRRFVGVGIIPKDEYLVVRDGPDNSSVVDPDARVLRFRYVHVDSTARKDSFITALGDLQSGVGGSIVSINRPTGIATFPGKGDFVLIQKGEGVQYTAIWMVYAKTFDFEGWIPKFDPSLPEQRSIDFVRPNRFSSPRAVAIDRYRSDIFIVDEVQDSVVKFNSRGFFKAESFGRTNAQRIDLKNPRGVAVAENTLYVCDTENARIVLYRLSTDL